ncbi:MAG: DNA polymerase III subunit delta [Paracoccaceae bacterium]
MKLSGARARGFCRAPNPQSLGALLYGPEPGLVALRRRELVAALVGEDDLRLTRLDAETARKSPADLDAALRARGFFPGRRAVIVEGAKDGTTAAIAGALEGLTAEDAFLVATAGQLAPRSSLRKLFEGPPGLAAVALYPDAPDTVEIAETLREEGCTAHPDPTAEARLAALATELDPGSFRQFLGTLALFARGAETITGDDVAALAPERRAAAVDAVVEAVTGGAPGRLGPALGRLASGGETAGSALSAVGRQLRLVHAIATDPGGPQAGADRRLRGRYDPRRAGILAALDLWPVPTLEAGIRAVHEAEGLLRSSGTRPDRALAERCLLRLAILSHARRPG